MKITVLALFLTLSTHLISQEDYLLIPDRVFDGKVMHDDWVVAVSNSRITYAGPAKNISSDSTIRLEGQTLMPGLIEGHSHILLHPYNETSWNDQVLKESIAERSARGVNHLKASLLQW